MLIERYFMQFNLCLAYIMIRLSIALYLSVIVVFYTDLRDRERYHFTKDSLSILIYYNVFTMARCRFTLTPSRDIFVDFSTAHARPFRGSLTRNKDRPSRGSRFALCRNNDTTSSEMERKHDTAEKSRLPNEL